MGKTYRIKDIAEMSGVSTGTVDRILHNRGKVSEEAQKKVEKVLKEIKIKKDVVDPDDVEMLEDLILTCVNEALRQVDSAQNQEFGKFNIPGLM